MAQFAAIVGFMVFAFGLMAIALHFSQYKKRENAGCCGGGSCSSGEHKHENGEHCESHDHSCSTGSCYSSKLDFVNNLDKIKVDGLKGRN